MLALEGILPLNPRLRMKRLNQVKFIQQQLFTFQMKIMTILMEQLMTLSTWETWLPHVQFLNITTMTEDVGIGVMLMSKNN
jgi:hypothetical protein